MLLNIVAHAGKIDEGIDQGVFQNLLVTNTGEFEDLYDREQEV